MKETRYFYVPEATEHNQLPADEASHAIRVLRLSPGDIVMLIDGIFSQGRDNTDNKA